MFLNRRNSLRRLALPAFASFMIVLGSVQSSQAALILQYYQAQSLNHPFQTFYTQTDAGGATETGFWNPAGSGKNSVPIQVQISMPIIGLNNVVAYMQFVNVHSVGPATAFYNPMTFQLIYEYQDFVGTVRFNSSSSFTGTNYLTATFTDPGHDPASPDYNPSKDSSKAFYAVTSPTTSALGASSSQHPDTVVFTSDVLNTSHIHITHGTEDFQLGFSDLIPPSGTVNTTTQAFIANGTGNFNARFTAAAVPEPSTWIGAALAGIGLIGLRVRRRTA